VLPLVPLALLLLPTLAQSGGNPFSLLDEHLMKSLQEARRLYLQLGLTEVAQSLESVSDTVVHYLSRLLPGIILAMSFLQAASCYGLSRAVIVRRRPDLPMPDRSSLALWHAPDTWVWGLIAALGLIAVPNGTLRFVGLNASLIYLVIYTAQGIAIVEYFQRKARIPAFWRSLLHVLILALPTVVAVVAFGIVDIWGDFRKVRTSATGTP